MAYQKKSPAEVSAARSRAALARKTHKGGRRKGSAKTTEGVKREAVKTIAVDETSYAVFSRLKDAKQTTMVEFMRLVADSLRAKNLALFETQPNI